MYKEDFKPITTPYIPAKDRFKAHTDLFNPVGIHNTVDVMKPAKNGLNSVLSKNSKVVAVELPEGNLIVNVCSPTYGLTPIDKIVIPFEEKLSEKFDFYVRYGVQNHSKFFIDYIFTKDESQLNGNDRFCPKLRLVHSYTGDMKFNLSFGVFRLICSNGLTIWDQKFASLTRKHTLSLNAEFMLEHLFTGINNMMEQMPEYVKVFETMQDRKITNFDERFEGVVKNTKYPSRLKDKVQSRITYEVGKLGTDMNEWVMFNAMNYQLEHNYDDLKMQESNRDQMNVSLYKEFAQ